MTSKAKRYETSMKLFHCKMTKGSFVNTHILFIIDNYLYTSYNSSSILDTGYLFHSYYNIKELKRSGRLCKGEMDLHVGHGARVIALIVETYY